MDIGLLQLGRPKLTRYIFLYGYLWGGGGGGFVET
jgi:hypothetical protein